MYTTAHQPDAHKTRSVPANPAHASTIHPSFVIHGIYNAPFKHSGALSPHSSSLLRARVGLPSVRFRAIQTYIELVGTAAKIHVLELLRGISVSRTGTLLIAEEAVRAISRLLGASLREGQLACAIDRETTAVANAELCGANLGSVGVEEDREDVCGKSGGCEDAAERDGFGRELHVCFGFWGNVRVRSSQST